LAHSLGSVVRQNIILAWLTRDGQSESEREREKKKSGVGVKIYLSKAHPQ
jgi:hypothetical protein